MSDFTDLSREVEKPTGKVAEKKGKPAALVVGLIFVWCVMFALGMLALA